MVLTFWGVQLLALVYVSRIAGLWTIFVRPFLANQMSCQHPLTDGFCTGVVSIKGDSSFLLILGVSQV
jgi:hypothetical protein